MSFDNYDPQNYVGPNQSTIQTTGLATMGGTSTVAYYSGSTVQPQYCTCHRCPHCGGIIPSYTPYVPPYTITYTGQNQQPL